VHVSLVLAIVVDDGDDNANREAASASSGTHDPAGLPVVVALLPDDGWTVLLDDEE
jgi:hypothetical protein